MASDMFEGNFAYEHFDDIPMLKEDVNSVMAVAFSKAKNDKEKNFIKMVAESGTDTIINAYHEFCVRDGFGCTGPDWWVPYEYFKTYGIESYEAFCESFVRNAWSALKAEEHVLDCIKEGYFDNDILRDILN